MYNPNSFAKAKAGISARCGIVRLIFIDYSKRRPGILLGVMILLIIISAVINFIFLHPSAQKPTPIALFHKSLTQPLPQQSGALMEILDLQAELSGFIDKKIPSQQDSIQMEQIIKRITQLNQKLREK